MPGSDFVGGRSMNASCVGKGEQRRAKDPNQCKVLPNGFEPEFFPDHPMRKKHDDGTYHSGNNPNDECSYYPHESNVVR